MACLLMSAVEFGTVLHTGGSPANAAQAALLTLALSGLAFIFAALVPGRQLVERVTLFSLKTAASLGVCLLAVAWIGSWITGRPLNGDAIQIIAGSPIASALHLLSSDPLLSGGIVAGFCLTTFVCFRSLHHAARALGTVSRNRLLLLLLLSGVLGTYAAAALARMENSRSTIAALLGSPMTATAAYSTYECRQSPQVPLEQPKTGATGNGVPVIVLMIESLRADLLTHHAEAIPTIAQLAGESLVFDRSYASASHSDFADLAFWYSRYPLRGERRTGYPRNAVWRGLSVFEYFKLHGYATGYFSSQNEKWGDMDNWLKIPAIDTYFDSENFSGETWENEDDSAGLIRLIRAGVARAGKVEDSHTLGFAAEWAERKAAGPFFLGLNLQNTHYHYYIPEHGERPFQPDQLGFRAVYAAWPKEQRQVVWNRYLNAAFNVDRALAQFIARLRRAGIWDRAIVLVVGDSGEAFYEHGFSNHSGPMYEEVARTLTLLKLPGRDRRNGERWTTPVSHVDLVPALVDLAGLDAWPGFQGQAPWTRTGRNSIYMTANAIVREDSVVQWPWKMLWRRFPDRSLELYDLDQDPAETRNLVESHPGIAVRLQQDLESWRTCQISYYADSDAHSRLQPPRYEGNAATD